MVMDKTLKDNFPVLGMSCAACASRVEKTISGQPGVVEASVNYASATVNVEYCPEECSPESLRKAVQDAGYDKTKKSFFKTLENLKTDYLDLYLVHMPYGDYHGSWRAMEELYKEGRVKAIGVCNFLEDRLTDLILSHEIVPAVNQMELHPFCQQKKLREVMKKYDIKPMAWAPFAEGKDDIFQNETLSAIGKKYGKTPAQVILCWLMQSGIIAIPKSVHEERLKENFSTGNFVLSDDDMKRIEAMDRKESLILNITSLDEVYRLHNIRFEQ